MFCLFSKEKMKMLEDENALKGAESFDDERQ